MRAALYYYVRLLALPLGFTLLFGTFLVLWQLLELPSPEAVAAFVEEIFATYGAPALFLGALIEGVLLVGNYFPGLFVIFLGVIVADSASAAARAVAIATAGLFLAHLANYALGRYGWYRLLVRLGLRAALDRSRTQLLARGPAAVYASYWMPNLAALTDTAAGIIRMPFWAFALHALVASVLWNTLVGSLVYTFKDLAFMIATPGGTGMLIIFAALGVWMGVLIVRDVLGRRSSPEV